MLQTISLSLDGSTQLTAQQAGLVQSNASQEFNSGELIGAFDFAAIVADLDQQSKEQNLSKLDVKNKFELAQQIKAVIHDSPERLELSAQQISTLLLQVEAAQNTLSSSAEQLESPELLQADAEELKSEAEIQSARSLLLIQQKDPRPQLLDSTYLIPTQAAEFSLNNMKLGDLTPDMNFDINELEQQLAASGIIDSPVALGTLQGQTLPITIETSSHSREAQTLAENLMDTERKDAKRVEAKHLDISSLEQAGKDVSELSKAPSAIFTEASPQTLSGEPQIGTDILLSKPSAATSGRDNTYQKQELSGTEIEKIQQPAVKSDFIAEPEAENLKLESAKLENAKLENTKLENTKLESAKLESTKLENTKLENTKLENIKLENTKLENTKLESAKLESAKLENTKLENTKLENTKLESAKLESAKLESTKLENAKLESTKLENIKLESTKLENIKLESAKLDSTKLENTKLENADLENPQFARTQQDVVSVKSIQREQGEAVASNPVVMTANREQIKTNVSTETKAEPVLTASDSLNSQAEAGSTSKHSDASTGEQAQDKLNAAKFIQSVQTMAGTTVSSTAQPETKVSAELSSPFESVNAMRSHASESAAIKEVFVSEQKLNLTHTQQAAMALKQEVNVLINKGLQQAEIRLDPAELGSILIKVQMTHEQASVQMQVQNPQAKELLDQTLPRLREMLAQQGIELAESDIQQQQQHEQGSNMEGQKSASSAFARSGAAAEAEVEVLKLKYNEDSAIDYYA